MKKDPIEYLYEQMAEDGLNEVRSYSTPPKRFRASEAANCMRQIWYRLSGYRPAPRDAEGKMYGVAGDADHDITRQLFAHYGIELTGVKQEVDGVITETLYPRKQFEVEHGGKVYKIDIAARADGAIPSVPAQAGRRSDRMTPNRLEATTTSNRSGLRTKCAVRMSTWYLSHATSG